MDASCSGTQAGEDGCSSEPGQRHSPFKQKLLWLWAAAKQGPGGPGVTERACIPVVLWQSLAGLAIHAGRMVAERVGHAAHRSRARRLLQARRRWAWHSSSCRQWCTEVGQRHARSIWPLVEAAPRARSCERLRKAAWTACTRATPARALRFFPVCSALLWAWQRLPARPCRV